MNRSAGAGVGLDLMSEGAGLGNHEIAVHIMRQVSDEANESSLEALGGYSTTNLTYHARTLRRLFT